MLEENNRMRRSCFIIYLFDQHLLNESKTHLVFVINEDIPGSSKKLRLKKCFYFKGGIVSSLIICKVAGKSPDLSTLIRSSTSSEVKFPVMLDMPPPISP